MIINKRSLKAGRWWIVFSAVALAAATVLYLRAGRDPIAGPSGGSRVGLVLGIAGFVMISFCMLLNVRKHYRKLRIGSVFAWMQGHVWIGLLSYPIILLHAGFHWGGPLTMALMWLFTIVEITGIIGLVLQRIVPRAMFDELSRETIYREIDRLTQDNLSRAHAIVEGCKLKLEKDSVGDSAAGGTATLAPPSQKLEIFYTQVVMPRFSRRARAGSLRTDFDAFRRDHLSASPREANVLRGALGDLDALVREQDNFVRQRRFQRVLAVWLLFHVPLSYGLYILAIAHAVMALRYQ